VAKKKRVLAALSAGALIVGASLSFATPASAYALSGCKLPSTTASVSNNAVLSKYITATNTAKSRWNAETQPVTFTTATSSSSARVFVTGWNAVDDYYAVTTGSCSGGVWSGQVRVTWNDTGSYALTTAQLRMVGIHEFGHVLGLDHVTRTCNGKKSVMVQGPTKWTCGWGSDDPWADDVNGVNAIY
jgi:hypothetical protein